ncbi:hypothetical protein NPIL_347711 [Nephila pilipes]|uniref:Uncharacterized protein n=1 Tax=Nephila pilipes TaxID=299642 RepID=A0A8X6UTD9_NEPPI|nr:hypothetical protein NPIL_347711 [Nephila pilipes]
MELARNREPGDENSSRPDTSITSDSSQENCEIRQNLENVIRKYSSLIRDLWVLIKNWETDPTFSPDYSLNTELCERSIQYSHHRTKMEGTLKSLPPCIKLSCLIHFSQIKPNSNERKDTDQNNGGLITP